jgi:hypothetical protein
MAEGAADVQKRFLGDRFGFGSACATASRCAKKSSTLEKRGKASQAIASTSATLAAIRRVWTPTLIDMFRRSEIVSGIVWVSVTVARPSYHGVGWIVAEGCLWNMRVSSVATPMFHRPHDGHYPSECSHVSATKAFALVAPPNITKQALLLS